MRYALQTALLLSLAAAGCQWNGAKPIEGTVNVAPPLLSRFEQPNTMLLIVARNPGGVPVALRRIVNPRFPCSFQLGPGDMILPGGWTGPLTLSAELSAHSAPEGLPVPEAASAPRRDVRSGETGVRLFVSAARPNGWASAKKPSDSDVSQQ